MNKLERLKYICEQCRVTDHNSEYIVDDAIFWADKTNPKWLKLKEAMNNIHLHRSMEDIEVTNYWLQIMQNIENNTN